MPSNDQRLTDPRVRARNDVLTDTRRRVIIEAARRVFAKSGLDGTSIRSIAAEAGCTTGAIYPWFAGKEEVYAAVLAESLDHLNAYIAKKIASELDVTTRARAGIEGFYRYYQKNPAEVSLGLYLFRGQGIQPTGLKKELDRDLNARLGAAVALIATAISEAGFDDATGRAADGICHATGLLIMTSAGRMKVFQSRPDQLMVRYLETSLPKLETGKKWVPQRESSLK